MADIDMKEAKYVYGQLREYLDAVDIHYDSNDEEMNVWFACRGDDMRILMDIFIDADAQRIRLASPFETKIPSEMRDEVAVAINKLNFGIVDGHMDLDYETGYIGYNLRIPYRDAVLSVDTFKYLITTTFSTVDAINEKFFLLAEGKITCEQLLNSVFQK